MVAAVATPVVMMWLSQPQRPGRREGDYRCVEYGRAYRYLMLFGCLFFGALAGLAYRFPGKTDPATLPWAISTFLFFALLSLVGSVLVARSTVYWNDRDVRGPNGYGKLGRIAWDELVAVDHVRWAQGFRLRSSISTTIWVYPMMCGFDEFFEQLRYHAEPRGLMPWLDELDLERG
jgi:hypothetical protein